MKNSMKFNTIDLFKFIFSIVIIAIHSSFLSFLVDESLYKVCDIITDLAVPYFFLCTGFLIFAKMEKPYNSKENLSKISKHIINSAKLYLMCRILYLPLDLIEHIKNGRSFIYNLLIFLRGLLVTGGYYKSEVFWYMLSSIYALIFIYLLLKKNVEPKNIFYCCLIISLFGYLCRELMKGNIGSPTIIKQIIQITISNGRVFDGFVYVSLGMIIADGRMNKKLSLIVFVTGFVLCYFTSNYIYRITTIICEFGLFNLILNMVLDDNNIYSFFRYSSKINYISHIYVITFLRIILSNNQLIFLVTCLICVVFGFILYTYKNKRIKV